MSINVLTNLRQKLATSRKIIVAQIQLLYECNFRCKHCYVEPNKFNTVEENRVLSLVDWKALLSYLRKRGAIFLRVSGGEPLISPHFSEIYELAWDLGYKIEVATNGYYIDRYKNLFARKKPHIIAMSLYGLSEQSYINFCESGSGTWNRILNNIYTLKNLGVNLQLNFMLNSVNAPDLNVVDLYRSRFNGLKMVCFRRIQCDTEGGSKPLRYVASNSDIVKSYLCFNDYINPLKEKLKGVWENPHEMCYAGLTSCYVSPYGLLYFCNGYEKEKFSIFPEGFEAAWEKITALRKDIEKKSGCMLCEKKDFCGMCYPSYMQLKRSGEFKNYCKSQSDIFRQMEKHVLVNKEIFENEKV